MYSKYIREKKISKIKDQQTKRKKERKEKRREINRNAYII